MVCVVPIVVYLYAPNCLARAATLSGEIAKPGSRCLYAPNLLQAFIAHAVVRSIYFVLLGAVVSCNRDITCRVAFVLWKRGIVFAGAGASGLEYKYQSQASSQYLFRDKLFGLGATSLQTCN